LQHRASHCAAASPERHPAHSLRHPSSPPLLKRAAPGARQALQHRSDTKMYRLQSPQTPLVRTARYGEFRMDELLAYTGARPPRAPGQPRPALLGLAVGRLRRRSVCSASCMAATRPMTSASFSGQHRASDAIEAVSRPLRAPVCTRAAKRSPMLGQLSAWTLDVCASV